MNQNPVTHDFRLYMSLCLLCHSQEEQSVKSQVATKAQIVSASLTEREREMKRSRRYGERCLFLSTERN